MRCGAVVRCRTRLARRTRLAPGARGADALLVVAENGLEGVQIIAIAEGLKRLPVLPVAEVALKHFLQCDLEFGDCDALEDLTLFYSYVQNVNRILGDDHPAGDFDSNSHLVHVSYAGCPWAKLTAYGYVLDFNNATAASSDTIGVSLTGGRFGRLQAQLSRRLRLSGRRRQQCPGLHRGLLPFRAQRRLRWLHPRRGI